MSKRKKRRPPLPALPSGANVIDTHCHLDMSAYAEDRRQVIERGFAAGLAAIVTIGIDRPSSEAAVRLAARHDGVYASVGSHPHHAAETSEADYAAIKALASHDKVRAYGEIGLDYVKDYAPRQVQIEHFIRQVRMAKELSLPLIIHDREAHDDTMAILRAHAPYPDGGVMHCFSGDMKLAEAVMALGFHISIPGVVTFNRAETMQEVARHVPLSRLLIETDGPFLTPEPYRGKRNEPAYVLYTAAKIAAIRKMEIRTLAQWTTANARRLFSLEDRCEGP